MDHIFFIRSSDDGHLSCFLVLTIVNSAATNMETEVTVLIAQLCPTLCSSLDCSHQASQSMEFSRQEYWSGLPFPSPGDLPDPGIEPGSPALEADVLTSKPPGKPKVILAIPVS